MSHRDTVFEPPPGFTALASSTASPVAAVESTERGIYGIQFHPEVVHTPYGQEILTRFLTEVCGCEPTWSAASIVEEQIARIREQVGDGRVICGLSGGVDSSVAALLVHRAVGEQLTCVFVDHGLMRKDEGEQVISAFRDTFKVPLVAVDAEERFLDEAQGRDRAEAKRKAIGAEFIRVFEEEAGKLADAGGGEERALPRAGHALLGRDRVRRRHRRGHDQVPPQRRRPARGPAVRARRAAAGAVQGRGPRRRAPSWACPSAWSGASRSPGPGLAIRVVGGEATKERLDVLREADHILQEEIRSAGLYRELWQSFCVLPGRAHRRRAGRRAHLRLRGRRSARSPATTR